MAKGPKFAHIWICWPSWWGLSFLCQTLDEKKSYEVQLCKQCTMDWKPFWISAAEPNPILDFRTNSTRLAVFFLVESSCAFRVQNWMKLGRDYPQLANILVVEIAVIRRVSYIIVASLFKLQPSRAVGHTAPATQPAFLQSLDYEL